MQEVVGIAVVTPPGHARASLGELQEHVAQKLHYPKWPQALVYLDRSGLAYIFPLLLCACSRLHRLASEGMHCASSLINDCL